MASGSWWAPRSSKPVRPSISAWRVRFPSASANYRRATPRTRRAVDQVDPRRLIPRTDDLLALPAVREARTRLSERVIRELVRQTQEQARRGELASRPGGTGPAGRRRCPHGDNPAPGAQRNRRHRPYQPRPRPAFRGRGRSCCRGQRLRRRGARPGRPAAAPAAAPAPVRHCSPPVPPPRTRWWSTTGQRRWYWPPQPSPPAGRWW